MKMKLGEIAALCEGELYQADPERIVRGVSIDSRTIAPDELYIPLIGERVDGHKFAGQVQDIAAASLWNRDHLPWPEFGVILVDDSQKALWKLAKNYAARMPARKIGITGSNGKTSTKDWLASILSQDRPTTRTLGNRNNEIGLPLTLLSIEPDDGYAVLEMGLDKPGDLDFLCDLVLLDGAIITSIGTAHLVNFESADRIAKAKLEISHGIKPGGFLVYPQDHRDLAYYMNEEKTLDHDLEGVFFSQKRLDQSIEPTENGSVFTSENEHYNIKDQGFQARNAAVAILAAEKLGLSPQKIQQGLDQTHLTAHRGQVIAYKNALIMDDTYKSNPEGAKKALDVLAAFDRPEKIAVLGDMLDLGEQSRSLHQSVRDHAKELGMMVIGYGELAKDLAESGKLHFKQMEPLVEFVDELCERPSAILIKGSNAMKMWEIIEALERKNTDEN